MTSERNASSGHMSTVLAVAALSAAAAAAWFNSFGGEFAAVPRPSWWLPFAGTNLGLERGLNVSVQVATALGIFGVLRHTLRLPHLRERFGAHATMLALATAAIWMLHPLQTAAVTDLGRRPELLGGWCVVLTLWAFVRGWRAASVVACGAGMAVHESTIVAPVLVLLYDRTFLTGSFGETWRARRGFYAALMATGVLVAVNVVTGNIRSEPVPWGEPLSPLRYLQVQCQAVVHYLRLALWPQPLVFDYGLVQPKELVWVLPPAFFLLALLVATGVAVWQARSRGFLGAWLFLLLLPTSSVWPVAAEPIAESRMHLPLAAIVTLVVLGLHRVVGRRSYVVCAVLALAAGAATVTRNMDYRDALVLWTDTAEKRPDNARAHVRLSVLQLAAGRVDEATQSGAEAVGLAPYYADAHYALGEALLRAGRPGPARRHLEQAAKLAPERFRAAQ